MTLDELQQRFQTAVLTEGQASVPLALSGHLEIYANAYRARLLEALRDNFPVLHRALGDEGFDALGLAFIAQHPSRFRSIRWFGDTLVAFAERCPDLLPHPALADLARMDWALRDAFDAADARPLLTTDLSSTPAGSWPALRFRLSPSVRLVPLSWQVGLIWQALNEDADAQTAPPIERGHCLLIWRRGLDCHWRSLDDLERAVLYRLAAGEPFAALCEAVAEAGAADATARVVALLNQWISEELFEKH